MPNATTATAAYVQRGESLDYANATDEVIPHGAIVPIGTRIGVTGCTIPPGQTGSLHVVGVFRIAKTGSAAVDMGQTVYFDGTGITGTAPSGEDAETVIPVGYAAAPAAASDTEILVKLNG